jgi:hypothetical protein
VSIFSSPPRSPGYRSVPWLWSLRSVANHAMCAAAGRDLSLQGHKMLPLGASEPLLDGAHPVQRSMVSLPFFSAASSLFYTRSGYHLPKMRHVATGGRVNLFLETPDTFELKKAQVIETGSNGVDHLRLEAPLWVRLPRH